MEIVIVLWDFSLLYLEYHKKAKIPQVLWLSSSTISPFTGTVILPVWVKYKEKPYVPLFSPVYNIIILNISSTYIENIRQYYNFGFKCQAYLENSREGKPVVFLHVFANYPSWGSFLLFPFCLENFFSHSFRINLLGTNSLIFICFTFVP